MTRAALIPSRLCLIPLGASAAELWATGDLLTTINEAKAVKPDKSMLESSGLGLEGLDEIRSGTICSGQGRAGLKDKGKLGYRVAFRGACSRHDSA